MIYNSERNIKYVYANISSVLSVKFGYYNTVNITKYRVGGEFKNTKTIKFYHDLDKKHYAEEITCNFILYLFPRKCEYYYGINMLILTSRVSIDNCHDQIMKLRYGKDDKISEIVFNGITYFRLREDE